MLVNNTKEFVKFALYFYTFSSISVYKRTTYLFKLLLTISQLGSVGQLPHNYKSNLRPYKMIGRATLEFKLWINCVVSTFMALKELFMYEAKGLL